MSKLYGVCIAGIVVLCCASLVEASDQKQIEAIINGKIFGNDFSVPSVRVMPHQEMTVYAFGEKKKIYTADYEVHRFGVTLRYRGGLNDFYGNYSMNPMKVREYLCTDSVKEKMKDYDISSIAITIDGIDDKPIEKSRNGYPLCFRSDWREFLIGIVKG